MHRTTSGSTRRRRVDGAVLHHQRRVDVGYGSAPTRRRPPASTCSHHPPSPPSQPPPHQVPDARSREAPNARTAAVTAPRPTRAAASVLLRAERGDAGAHGDRGGTGGDTAAGARGGTGGGATAAAEDLQRSRLLHQALRAPRAALVLGQPPRSAAASPVTPPRRVRGGLHALALAVRPQLVDRSTILPPCRPPLDDSTMTFFYLLFPTIATHLNRVHPKQVRSLVRSTSSRSPSSSCSLVPTSSYPCSVVGAQDGLAQDGLGYWWRGRGRRSGCRPL